MDSLLRDFAFAARTLRRNAAFTLTALLTLALGVGASTAIFSVVNAVLIRPLPYAAPQRLLVITSDLVKRDARDIQVVPGDLKDLRMASKHLSGVAGVFTARQALVGDDAQPEQLSVGNVTTNFFGLLGVGPLVGRDFADEDGSPAPAPPAATSPSGTVPRTDTPAPLAIVILSHEFWQRRYGGDRKILNRVLNLGAGKALVVGVLRPGFELHFATSRSINRKPDLYTALRVDWDNASRANGSLTLVGRLRDGATQGEAQAELDAVGAELRGRFALKETAGLHFRAEPMAADLVREMKPVVVALMGSAFFVLLIACANVANLMLVRASRRESEQAVRAALGGSRVHLAQAPLAEAMLLSTVGGIAGILLAVLGVRVLGAVAPDDLPRVDAVTIDPTVLGFALVLMLAATCAFGALPALRASRPDLMTVLRPGGRTVAPASARAVRNGVVMAEVALAYALLVGCGLMVRSFVVLSHVNAGYDPAGVMTFSLQNARPRTPDEKAAFTRAVRDALAAIPGVQSVTAAYPFPLDGNSANLRWGTEAAAGDPGKFLQGSARFVLPNFFEAMRTPLIEGRTFTDAENAPAGTSVVIDQVLAAKAFPGQSAVGKRLLSRFRTPEPEFFDVIGVVAHQRHESLTHEGRETLFFADGMIGYGFATRWAVRHSGAPQAMAPRVRAAIAAVDPLVPVAELKPMSVYVRRSQAPTRFALICIGVFAAVAVTLAAVGLFGTLATIVRQRTMEIGVRMAFGASRSQVLRLVVGHGMQLTAAGIAIGLGVAYGLTKVMQSLLVGVERSDPTSLVVVTLVFVVIAAIACWIPARRAALLDPAGALRDG